MFSKCAPLLHSLLYMPIVAIPENAILFLTEGDGGREKIKARGLILHLSDCCELLSQFTSCLNFLEAGSA